MDSARNRGKTPGRFASPAKRSALARGAPHVGDVLGYPTAVRQSGRLIRGESEMSHDPGDRQSAAFSRFASSAIWDSTYV